VTPSEPCPRGRSSLWIGLTPPAELATVAARPTYVVLIGRATTVPFTTDASGRMRTPTDNPTAAMTAPFIVWPGGDPSRSGFASMGLISGRGQSSDQLSHPVRGEVGSDSQPKGRAVNQLRILPMAFVMIAGPQILSAIFLATSQHWQRNTARLSRRGRPVHHPGRLARLPTQPRRAQ
jgi:hypothetical protein